MRKAIVRKLFNKWLLIAGVNHPRYGITKLDVIGCYGTKTEAVKEAVEFNFREERTGKCRDGS